METKISKFIFKFNKKSSATLDDIKESKLYKIREKLCEDKPLTDEEKDFLIEEYNTNSCKVLGFQFFFWDVMKRFYGEGEYANRLFYALDLDSAIRFFSEYSGIEENECFDVYELNFLTTAVK